MNFDWDDGNRVKAQKHGLTLSEIEHAMRTGARVAPEPWPFESYPDVAVDVRIEEMLPMDDGTYRVRGMAFVAPAGDKGRDRARSFELSVPYDQASGYSAIAAARSALIAQLAMMVVRQGMR